MSTRRVKWAIATGLVVTVAGCAAILDIQDIPDGAVAEAGSDAATDAASDAADSGIVALQSCAADQKGQTNCGDGGESCCTSLPVTGGAYHRTYVNNGSGPAGIADLAMVADFRLDKYEVTVGRFRPFVSAWNAGWRPPASSGKHTHLDGGQGLVNSGNDAGVSYETGWVTSDNSNVELTDANLTGSSCGTYGTWTKTAMSQENLPINCVNWYESAAFCIWDGGFLPSEAEWEYAAAGGTQERQYPWGNAAPGTKNLYAVYGCNYLSDGGSCTDVTNVAPVGTPTSGAGRWGQLDLAGSVFEWNLDWHADYVPDCENCAALTAEDPGRVNRGGAFDSPLSLPPSALLPTFRSFLTSTNRSYSVGLRCARKP